MTEPITVLHVDDDPEFTELVATFLEREDDRFVVESATDADEGLARLAEDGVDCVVSDYDMPGMNGIDFLEAVREVYGELPFILFTGKGSETVASDAISAGVTDYLRKGRGTERYTILAHRVSNAVTARRSRIESERRRKRLEGILKTVPGCVVRLDTEGRFIFANDRAVEVLGLERSAVTDRAYNDPEWRIKDTNGDPIPDEELPFRRVRDTGEPLYGIRADGEVLWVEGRAQVVDDGDSRRLIGIHHDITERKRREQELERTKRRLDSILENTPMPMFMKDTDGEYMLVNRHYRELFGLEDGAVIGYTDAEIHPPSTVSEVRANDQQVLESGEPLSAEERIVVDGEKRHFLVSKAPIYDETTGDRPTAVFGIAKDISEREAYRKQLEGQNELLEELAAVVGHDLRSPLTVAQGRLELAADDCDSPHLDAVADALDRSQELVGDLLALAREGSSAIDAESVPLANAVQECWRTVETANATLAVETARTIRADRGRLKQLLQNLVRNAVEHGGSDVTLSVGDLPGGFYVADDGPGIPEAERDRIFEVGYSTEDGNTGFGLGIVGQVIADHGWSVAVAESDGGGARFEITGVESA